MKNYLILIIAWAYIIGLVSTAFLNIDNLHPIWLKGIVIISGLGLITVIIAFNSWQIFKRSITWQVWLSAWLVATFAIIYFGLRLPQPGVNDLSHQLTQFENNFSPVVSVTGKIIDSPRLTSKGKLKFQLKAQQFQLTTDSDSAKKVTGKAYVTVPLLQGTGLYPGQRVTIIGNLYQPQTSLNPGGFDFQDYLRREGIFTGLSGKTITSTNKSQGFSWGMWQLQKRITQAQLRWLYSPAGQLVVSMVLGKQAVDLPYYIRDQFMNTGLAHALASSGFQVSLLLGLVLFITKKYSEKSQLITGISVLILYLGLTGVQPAIFRATLMGIAGLIGLVLERKVKPLGSLLIAVIILLLFNPLWIWDLGFQLSFLATFGLIVTMPSLQRMLDWLPTTIAEIVAIPIAASLWTLPLTSYVFKTIPIYSIITNIVVTPLIMVISLGGMVSALIAIIIPIAGSAIAWLLYIPTHLLIIIIDLFNKLPGSTFAIGKIHLGQMLLVYGLMLMIWLSPWFRQHWHLITLAILTLIIVPLWYRHATLIQVTVLATPKQPVVILQDHGQTALINNVDPDLSRYSLIPFLQSQGINHLNYAISLDSPVDWSAISHKIPIQNFNLEHQNLPHLKIELLPSAQMITWRINNQNWWLLNRNFTSEHIDLSHKPDIIIYNGKVLPKNIIAQSAIATGSRLDSQTKTHWQHQQTQFYWTQEDGSIQWTPQTGFKATLVSAE